MLKYRHRKFGHIVDVLEPADVLAQADIEAERVARVGTKRAKRDAEAIGEYAIWQANRQRQTLARMDESRKWERYTPPAEEPAKAPPPPAPAAPPADSSVETKPAKRTPAKAVETAE
ncbi:MAG TPA: hypothetical protein VF223_04780 [Trebonia sp.]